ncbi:hypothetical protein HK102_013165 [Quaeritorhiza haematococci]|nr:hypothetical protein HK102_013165 [Quaeritorhiza haematococci]
MSTIEWPAVIAIVNTVNLLTALFNTGFGVSRSLPSQHEFYGVRTEAGIGEGASGHALKVKLFDYQGKSFKGYITGNAGDRCWLKKGIGLGEAPYHKIKTTNGFNLKTVNIYPGGNGVCVSNIILKGGESAARQDEIYIPGDLLAFCGYAWNWGARFDGVDQRCVWIGKPHPYPAGGGGEAEDKTLGILSMDVSRLQTVMDRKTWSEAWKRTTVQDICKLFKDASKGPTPEPNVHRCARSRSSDAKLVPITSEQLEEPKILNSIPMINIDSTTFMRDLSMNPNFIGGPFMTRDGVVYIPREKKFVHPKQANPQEAEPGAATGEVELAPVVPSMTPRDRDDEPHPEPIAPSLSRASTTDQQQDITRRGLDDSVERMVDVKSCSRSGDSEEVVCTVVKRILLPVNLLEDPDAAALSFEA